MGVKQFIKKIPVPICGLSLALASLDRFLSGRYDVYILDVCAFIAFFIAILFTLRILVDHRGVLKDIENPAVFAVLPTYTMTLLLLTAYVKDHLGGIAGDVSLAIWLGAIIASYVIMFFFVKRFFFNFSIEKVFPSWIIIFVGYVVASVTSPSFGMEWLGQIIFWSGFIGYLSLLPLLVYRTLMIRKIPESLVPQIAIFAAPVNLCIAGCMYAYDNAPPEIPLTILVVLGVISYVVIIGYLPIMLNRKFYPSYAALTFPLVISAVSFYKLGEYYGISSNAVFHILQETTVVIAILIVAYVLIRYSMFLFQAVRRPTA